MSNTCTITFLNVSEEYTEEEIKLVDNALDALDSYDINLYFEEDIYNNTYTNDDDAWLVQHAVNKFNKCLKTMSNIVDKSVIEKFEVLTKKINDHYNKAVN